MATTAAERTTQILDAHTGIMRGIAGRLDSLEAQFGRSGRGFSVPGFTNAAGMLLAVYNLRTRVNHSDPRFQAASTFGGVGIGPDGGFAAEADHLDPVWQAAIGEGSLLGYFNPIVTDSGYITICADEDPSWGTAGLTAAITSEGTAITPTKAVLRGKNVNLVKVAALHHASREIVEDAPSYAAFAYAALARKLRAKVEALIVSGTGMTQPTGLLNTPSKTTVTRSGAGAFAAADVGGMMARLLPGSYPTAIWVVHSSVLPKLAALAPLYTGGPGFGTLAGRPVVVTESASALGTSGDVILTDPAGFMYGLNGPRSSATIAFGFDQDIQSFRATVRVGGAPVLSAPVTRTAGSDTLSHVVVLS